MDIKDICYKILVRLFDVNVGSVEGTDVFRDVENRDCLIYNVHKYLYEFSLNKIDKETLRKNLMGLQVEIDTNWLQVCFIKDDCTLKDLIWWQFEENEFEKLLTQKRQDYLHEFSWVESIYLDNIEEFEIIEC